MVKTKVVKAKVRKVKDLKATISKAVKLLGGFEKFVKRGESILLKPNFNTDDPFPASTDIKFLEAVIDLVWECQPKAIIIGDSCTLSMNTDKVMRNLGIFKLQKTKNIKIYNFDKYDWIKKYIPKAKYLKKVSITKFVDAVDKIILLPCLKTHKNAVFTGSLKLSIGFVKPMERIRMHLAHLQEKIAELNTLINPALVLMDARKCFINKGPSRGDVREPDLILASTDRIAIDVEGIKIIKSFSGNSIKLEPWQIPQIKRAVQLGLGARSEKDYEVIEIEK